MCGARSAYKAKLGEGAIGFLVCKKGPAEASLGNPVPPSSRGTHPFYLPEAQRTKP